MLAVLRSSLLLLKDSQAVRQSAQVAVGNFITGVIMALAMILVSRALGPDQFGVFSVSIALMTVGSKGLDVGLNFVIPRFLNQWRGEDDRILELLAQITRWKLTLGAVTIGLGLVLIPWLETTLNYPYTPLLVWAVLGSVVTGAYEHVGLILSARHKFGWVSILSAAQALIKFFGFLLLYFAMRQRLEAYAGIYFLAPFVAALWLVLRFPHDFFIRPRSASRKIRQDIFRFLGHAGIGVFGIILIQNIDVLMIQSTLSSYETGLYAGASRISLLITFVTAAIGTVLNNRVARYQDLPTLYKYLRKSLALVALALLGFLLFLPLARLSIVLTIGEAYLEGLIPLIILVGNSFLAFALVPYVAVFFSLNKPNYFSIGALLQLLIIVGGNALFLAEHGLLAAAVTKVVATLCYAIFTLLYLYFSLKKMRAVALQRE